MKIAFVGNSERLIIASIDGDVIIWDTSNGSTVQVLSGHPGGVQSISLNGDNTLLSTSTTDGIVQIWDLRQGVPSAANMATVPASVRAAKQFQG